MQPDREQKQYLCKVSLVCAVFNTSPHALRNFNTSATDRKQVRYLTSGNRCDSSSIYTTESPARLILQ